MSWKVIYHPDVTGDLESLGRAEAARVMRVIDERIRQGEPDKINISRVDQFLPMLQVDVCVLRFRLVSRRCHIISTIHQLALTPLRTVLALFTHTAPHIVNSQKIQTS